MQLRRCGGLIGFEHVVLSAAEISRRNAHVSQLSSLTLNNSASVYRRSSWHACHQEIALVLNIACVRVYQRECPVGTIPWIVSNGKPGAGTAADINVGPFGYAEHHEIHIFARVELARELVGLKATREIRNISIEAHRELGHRVGTV